MSPREGVEAWVRTFDGRDAAASYHHDVDTQLAEGTPTVGRAAVLEGLRAPFLAFPNSFTRIENLFVEGEWVGPKWSGGGTWKGPFAGQAPNGRTFALRGCGFFQVVDGKIRTQRGYWDRATWFGQLGIPLAS